MAITVVDGGNLEQALSEAGVEPEKVADKPADKPKVETEAKPEEDDADDVEDDEGVTARQKRELSGKMLKAIGKKHRQVKEAEEFAAHQYRATQAEKSRADELERQLQQSRPAPKEETEPSRDKFATEDQYIDAKIKWGVDQGIRQREAERIAAARTANVQEQYAKAAELVPDFESVVNKQLNYPRNVVEYMRESTMFAELGYHFGTTPKDLERLVSLTPVRQLVELGKIEAKLRPFGSSESSSKADDESDNGKAKAKPSAVDTGFSPSKARSDAPVIKPLTGGEGSVEVDPRAMNTRQMIEDFQKTNKVNLHARKRH